MELILAGISTGAVLRGDTIIYIYTILKYKQWVASGVMGYGKYGQIDDYQGVGVNRARGMMELFTLAVWGSRHTSQVMTLAGWGSRTSRRRSGI